MPKCPKCQKEIDCLIEIESTTVEARVSLRDERGRSLLYEHDKETERADKYDCPKCYATLPFISCPNDAAEFLRGNLSLSE